MGKLISASEAAKQLGVSRTVIYRLVERGLLKRAVEGAVIIIDSDDLKDENLKNRKNGRPFKITVDNK